MLDPLCWPTTDAAAPTMVPLNMPYAGCIYAQVQNENLYLLKLQCVAKYLVHFM